MRSIIRIVALAVLFAAAAVVPLAAQGFVYQDIAWGSDPRTTTDQLAQHGFALDAEASRDLGELFYTSTDNDGVLAFATFSGDQLVGIRIVFAGANADELFTQSLREWVQALGEPDEVEDGMATWVSEDTDFSLMLNETDNGDRYVAAQYAGPGFHEEIERRMAEEDAPRELPALEDRWELALERPEVRTAFDRTTLQPAGNRVFRVWLRNDYTQLQTDPVEHDAELHQMEYDCGNRRFRVVASLYHLEQRVVQSDTTSPPSDWMPAPPESVGEALIAAVCRRAERR